MSAFSIRKYATEDYSRCRALWRELTEWHRHIYDSPHIGGDTPEDAFDEHLAKVGLDCLWVAIHGVDVVGLVGLILKKDEAEIEPLIVRQQYRRRGIGRLLVERVIAEVRKLPIIYLNVQPVARNIEALQFFHHQGFHTIGHIQLFIDMKERPWKTGVEIHSRQFDY